MEDLARLLDIRQRRVERAQQAYQEARAAQVQAEARLAHAQQAHADYRKTLPSQLQAAFTPVVGQQVGLTKLTDARQTEANLYTQLDDLRLACDEARDAFKQAQEKTLQAHKFLQQALRKQEALRLLEAEDMAMARLASERAADAVIDEFAEQSFWQNR